MAKQDIVFTLNVKYEIVENHVDTELEVPNLLIQEIRELEEQFVQLVKGV